MAIFVDSFIEAETLHFLFSLQSSFAPFFFDAFYCMVGIKSNWQLLWATPYLVCSTHAITSWQTVPVSSSHMPYFLFHADQLLLPDDGHVLLQTRLKTKKHYFGEIVREFSGDVLVRRW